jgi:hypothetical protein
MLVKSQDVSYGQLVRQFGTISEIVMGVKYQGNVFVKGNSYPQQQRQMAITEMRRNFLDPEPAIACLLVEDGEIVTIWYEDRYIIKVVENSQDLVKYFNLAELVEYMRLPNGVEIKSRKQSFRLPYPNCFVGREAVDWIVARLPIDRISSIDLGQRLLDDKWIRNLSNQEPFRDADLFYQFITDA